MPGNTLIGEENHDEIDDDAALAATTAFATPALASSDDHHYRCEFRLSAPLTAPGTAVSVATSGTTDLGTANLICNECMGFTATCRRKLAVSWPTTDGHSPTTSLHAECSSYGVSNLALTQADLHDQPGKPAAAGRYHRRLRLGVNAQHRSADWRVLRRHLFGRYHLGHHGQLRQDSRGRQRCRPRFRFECGRGSMR